ncbi:sulfatase family protein [Novosphingobium aerophilum]|uniref:Sulfatase-like hydrolase/transferase n=1 Tax=Novosphingobium aerophilum TaxID=2839843 RepID=A0A7X1KDR1_9SPHN|nr:sulfatase [Novosphingobium aerophilum]MBC2653584.1 sulfatase-like hydrolase/transferase [Novosphingobium aerophilum]
MTLSRRTALQALAASVVAGHAPMLSAEGNSLDRPNILWIVSEDNNPFIGAYGDRQARTPNIDALAKRGVLYRNVYSPAPVCAPTRFAILTGAYAETCSPAQHMRANAHLPAELRTYPEHLHNAGYYCTNNPKTDYNCDVVPARIWDESSPTAHWRNRPNGKPFLSVFNLMTTHESSLFRLAEGRERFRDVRIPAYLPPTAAIREDYASYYALMSAMDAQVGARLKELEDDGLAQDTIVFYYSDNGGVLPRSKRYCYDEGLRVAMVVYVPPKWRHLCPVPMGSEVTAPVNLVDLAPTLLSLADIPTPKTMQGRAFLGRHAAAPATYSFGMRNRMDERYDMVRTVTDGRYRYIRNYMPHRIWGMRGDFEWNLKSYQSWETEHLAGRLNPDQSRFFGPKPFEELYDLASDPDQLHNLVAAPAQRQRVAILRQALDRHMLAIVDNGFIPEGSPAEGYAASRDKSVYPLKAVMALAQAAARGDPRKLGLMTAALSHPNGVMRYWAATGLLTLKDRAHPAAAQLAKLAAGDPWASVRVVAAEALCHVGRAGHGVAVLATLSNAPGDIPPRLMALNALDSLGDMARPAMPALATAAGDPNEYISRAAKPLLARLKGEYRPDVVYSSGRPAGV